VTYKKFIRGLKGLSLKVGEGSIVALLGANGAGKTTALRAISGLLPVHQGVITRGDILFDGRVVTGRSAVAAVRGGITQAMEGRHIFAELTVEENLRVGAFTRRDRDAVKRTLDHILELFPVLRERYRSLAGYLSGGQQQMLAIGRAWMAKPRLLLLDEPSLGLAPKIIEDILNLILRINREGVSVLLVEQKATMALSIATYGYIIESGRTVVEGARDKLIANPIVREHYLGVAGTQRRSFRERAAYRSRERIVS
jgi:branched-chain amino acid transport system ATP-binding protein